MQTFLPYPDFVESAKVLDNKRLGKQRVEVYQILRTLTGESNGWRNHPAVRMWRGYEDALRVYGYTICSEWIRRGYNDTLRDKIGGSTGVLPPWFGDDALHASHRSNLLRKLPGHYRQFWPDDTADLPYVWPIGRD